MNLFIILRPELVLLAATMAPVFPLLDPEALGAEAAGSPALIYEQKLYRAETSLVGQADAANVINRFRSAYSKLGSPRFLIYVNRDLVDTRSGFKLAGREETVVSNHREASRDLTSTPAEATEASASGINVSNIEGTASRVAVDKSGATGGTSGANGRAAGGEDSQTARAVVSSVDRKLANVNRYERVDREEDSFEYRQLARELEQVFGRRLRAAGATLADQKVATALIADRPLRDFVTPTEGEQARKDREALARVADVVIEILIANRDVTVSRVSGPVSRSRPEIHAAAVRLSDARVMAQAASTDREGSASEQSQVLRLGSREIADATALQLMDDMLLGLQP